VGAADGGYVGGAGEGSAFAEGADEIVEKEAITIAVIVAHFRIIGNISNVPLVGWNTGELYL